MLLLRVVGGVISDLGLSIYFKRKSFISVVSGGFFEQSNYFGVVYVLLSDGIASVAQTFDVII